MKIRWLVKFNDREPGHVADRPDSKARFWINKGMAEEVKPEPKAKPVKKVIEGPEVKK